MPEADLVRPPLVLGVDAAIGLELVFLRTGVMVLFVVVWEVVGVIGGIGCVGCLGGHGHQGLEAEFLSSEQFTSCVVSLVEQGGGICGTQDGLCPSQHGAHGPLVVDIGHLVVDGQIVFSVHG